MPATLPPSSPLAPLLGWLATSSAGAALLALIGVRYRLDAVRCPAWVPLTPALFWTALFLLGVALLIAGWLRTVDHLARGAGDGRSFPALLGLLLGPHLIALLGLPGHSDDPLAYAAVGRAITLYGASGYAPLGASLPSGDAVRNLIERYPAWLEVGSAYGPLWNGLAALVVRLAPGSLVAELRLFQGIACGGIVATALVVAATARRVGRLPWGPPATEANPPRAARVALAMVLLCPLSIVEGTLNAHNDALLALGAALFAWALVRGRPAIGVLALAAATLVKASGGLLLALYLAHLGIPRLIPPSRRNGRTLSLLVGLLLALTVAAVLLLQGPLLHYASTVARLIGRPDDALPYCTRSIECFPRAFAHFVLGSAPLSWAIGLLFRAGAVVLLLWFAMTSPAGPSHLGSAARFAFLYYLLFHASNHAWYGLMLLPLVPFLDGRLRRGLVVFLACGIIHYAADLPFNCDFRPLTVGLSEVFEGAVTIVPALVVVLRRRAGD